MHEVYVQSHSRLLYCHSLIGTLFCFLFSSKQAPTAIVDVSRNAQIAAVEASFKACNDDFTLETLRHPNNPRLTAVESYPVLPDADIWANQYDLFRFTERPGDRANDVEDERLDCAVLRPMRTEYDSFLAYYLTKDDNDALDMKHTRASLQPYEVPDEQEVSLTSYPDHKLMVLLAHITE